MFDLTILDFEDEFCECGHQKTEHHYSWVNDDYSICSAWCRHETLQEVVDCVCIRFEAIDWVTNFCNIPQELK